FVGGCTLDAAERVMGDGSWGIRDADEGAQIPSPDILEGLYALVAHNLLRQEEQADGEPRLTMLELIHDFAREQLVASGELDAVADAHAAFYLALAARAVADGAAIEPAVWQVHLDPERGNLRAALARRRERGAAIGMTDDEFVRLRAVLDPFLR
ncbi:MAG: hypothetical protein ICV72_14595, partial [Aldersonia sp.]|nr:hypothetical protein [Aldersonia sp.]